MLAVVFGICSVMKTFVFLRSWTTNDGSLCACLLPALLSCQVCVDSPALGMMFLDKPRSDILLSHWQSASFANYSSHSLVAAWLQQLASKLVHIFGWWSPLGTVGNVPGTSAISSVNDIFLPWWLYFPQRTESASSLLQWIFLKSLIVHKWPVVLRQHCPILPPKTITVFFILFLLSCDLVKVFSLHKQQLKRKITTNAPHLHPEWKICAVPLL